MAFIEVSPSTAFTTNDIFISDEPWAIIIMFIPFSATHVNIFAAMPGVPLIPSPITDIAAMSHI